MDAQGVSMAFDGAAEFFTTIRRVFYWHACSAMTPHPYKAQKRIILRLVQKNALIAFAILFFQKICAKINRSAHELFLDNPADCYTISFNKKIFLLWPAICSIHVTLVGKGLRDVHDPCSPKRGG